MATASMIPAAQETIENFKKPFQYDFEGSSSLLSSHQS